MVIPPIPAVRIQAAAPVRKVTRSPREDAEAAGLVVASRNPEREPDARRSRQNVPRSPAARSTAAVQAALIELKPGG